MQNYKCGCIYVEATMNSALQHLLASTPGIIFRPPGVLIKFPIGLNDHVAMLTLPKRPVDSLKVGDWARIVKGLYKRDIGLVVEAGEWVRLLVVPRLWPPWVS